MRVTGVQLILMVILSTLVSAAALNGQGILDSKISLDVNNMEIKSILVEIEKQVPVNFTYRPKLIQSTRKVSLTVSDTKLREVLDHLFSPSIEFVVVGEEIVLKPVETTTNEPPHDALLAIAITGKITDENSSPIPGANILVKGTTTGTTSDSDGKYALNVEDQNAVLVISFIGYTTQEITVGTQTTINIQLAPDVTSLNEVVVKRQKLSAVHP